MKEILALLLAAIMCLYLVACSSGETAKTNDSNETLDNNSANSILIYDKNGDAYINKKILTDLVETVELTTENWREYIKAYK